MPSGPWNEEKWLITEKVHNSLEDSPFDDRSSSYKPWSDKIKTHLSLTQRGWLRVLQPCEQESTQISRQRLRTRKVLDGNPVNLEKLSEDLWALFGLQFTKSVINLKLSWAGNKGWNGLELWRRMFIRFRGGAESNKVAGVQEFHNSPTCEDASSIVLWVGKRQRQQAECGKGIPELNMLTMIMNMLRGKLRKEVDDRRDRLQTLQQVTDDVLTEHARHSDLLLAKKKVA